MSNFRTSPRAARMSSRGSTTGRARSSRSTRTWMWCRPAAAGPPIRSSFAATAAGCFGRGACDAKGPDRRHGRSDPHAVRRARSLVGHIAGGLRGGRGGRKPRRARIRRRAAEDRPVHRRRADIEYGRHCAQGQHAPARARQGRSRAFGVARQRRQRALQGGAAAADDREAPSRVVGGFASAARLAEPDRHAHPRRTRRQCRAGILRASARPPHDPRRERGRRPRAIRKAPRRSQGCRTASMPRSSSIVRPRAARRRPRPTSPS